MKFIFLAKYVLLGTFLIHFASSTAYSNQTNFVSFDNFSEKKLLNEAPIITWNHPKVIEVKSGTVLDLEYSCADPDFHRMNAFIRQNHETSTGHSKMVLKASLNKLSITVPASASRNELYVIDLEIKDEGNPPMSAIQSFTIKII